jgi:hypothetical protein
VDGDGDGDAVVPALLRRNGSQFCGLLFRLWLSICSDSIVISTMVPSRKVLVLT